MRIAALYDIHGNLPALVAVLEDIRKASADQVVVGGDVIPGPMPKESIELLLGLDLPTHFIHGNGEREVLVERSGGKAAVPEGFREVMRWTGEQLSPEQAGRLAQWPSTLRLDMPALGSVLFCHATPRNDTELFTRLTPEERLLPVFGSANAPLVVCGHTHMQFDRTVGATRVVNAGSVGMPFGTPGAYWLLLGRRIELRCTRYDLAEAAERIRATNYPQAEEFASGNVLQPPPEGKMLEMFERSAL